MLGSLPVAGMGKVSAALPLLASVTVCALLVAPSKVEAKLSDGGVASGISFTKLLPMSATKTLPALSTATPKGWLKPPPSVVTQLELVQPAGISFTKLLPLSAT